MEAIKGVIMDHGKVEAEGKQRFKYLIGFVLVTDHELTNVIPLGETIIMGVMPDELGMATDAMQLLSKYVPPHPLGSLDQAILQVVDMNPLDLEPTTKLPVPKPTKRKKKSREKK